MSHPADATPTSTGPPPENPLKQCDLGRQTPYNRNSRSPLRPVQRIGWEVSGAKWGEQATMGSMTQANKPALPPNDVLQAPIPSELARLAHERDVEIQKQSGDWVIWNSTGDANSFHHYQPEQVGHEIWTRSLSRPALVLGSTQSEAVLNSSLRNADLGEQELEICKRRSGGGLVYLDVDHDVWIDVLIPVTSPLWHHDLAKAFHWLGDIWAAVLAEFITDAVISSHRGPSQGSGQLLCFAGLGHGEVSVDGYKVVGLSQRRTRSWTRLQCAVIQRWPAEQLTRMLTDPQHSADELPIDPSVVRAGLGPPRHPIPRQNLIEGFLTAMVDQAR